MTGLKRALVRGAVLVTVLASVGAFAVPAYAAPSVATPPGPYAGGQTVTVSGTGFAKRASGASIEILMCADPDGTTANLPRDNTSCDGTTLNPETIYPTGTDPGPPGNFTAKYLIQELSAKSQNLINCDATHYCVLWVGEDYVGNFYGTPTDPVAYSQPFLVGTKAGADGSSSTSVVVGIVIAVVVLGGGGAFIWWRRRRRIAA